MQATARVPSKSPVLLSQLGEVKITHNPADFVQYRAVLIDNGDVRLVYYSFSLYCVIIHSTAENKRFLILRGYLE
jgi:hypothetical protein